jgi:enduracididine biosynthesis enzyme MppQ
MSAWAGVTQHVPAPGVCDLGPGYLDPDLLPVDLVRAAYATALTDFGPAALTYGDNRGALVLREELARRASCEPEQVVVTAGTSHALHLIATTFASAGDVVVVDEVGYDLGRRIFTDCGLRLRTVPADGSGMTPDGLRAALDGASLLYLTPTHHNPTGLVMPLERRRELLAVAAGRGVLVVEDDAYAGVDLEPGFVPPPPLAALAGHRGVIHLRTFSKTLAAGLRLGWLLTDEETARKLTTSGLFESGGSLNHLAALAVSVLVRSGDLDRHAAWLRAELRERRDALAGALGAGSVPAGGFFLWLPGGDRRVAGVEVASGARYGAPGFVRLAYSAHPPETLKAAGDVLAAAWRLS